MDSKPRISKQLASKLPDAFMPARTTRDKQHGHT